MGALRAAAVAPECVAMFGYFRRRVAPYYAARDGLGLAEDTWGS